MFAIENDDDDIIYVIDVKWEHVNSPNKRSSGESYIDVEYMFSYNYPLIQISPKDKYDFRCAPVGDLNFPEKYPAWDHCITIWKKETMDKYSKQELREKNIYDAQYILSSDQIYAMGSVVHYPLEGYESAEQ